MEFSDLKDHPSRPNSGVTLTIAEISDVLDARVLCCEEKLQNAIHVVCGCDLISDMLAFTRPGSLLLTGLTNSQVIRTAEILDLTAIIFVRGKTPDSQTIAMARDAGIPLLTSPFPLYESCG
ncbi:MAG TPA: DRTGG domain-containing protein, partial [Armatimonadota bacterium]